MLQFECFFTFHPNSLISSDPDFLSFKSQSRQLLETVVLQLLIAYFNNVSLVVTAFS